MLTELRLNHGVVPLPAFFPDGTYGAVRCVDSADLVGCGVRGLVMNSYHLLVKPGVSVIREFGGLRAFAGWNGPILTDSGGFQVFSLIRENPKYGEIRKNEVIFRPDGGKEKIILTPEKCVAAQFTYGSDIIMCLDHCTRPDDSYDANAQSVETTVEWAKRCKREYERQMMTRRIPDERRPLIFGIIQGGGFFDLRRECADALKGVGFDGYGFGGWPMNSGGELVEDILEHTARLMPDDTPKYAMGLGKPDEMAKCLKMGYNLFDCVIPTREARHNRLYVFNNDGNGGEGADPLAYSHYYILDERHIRDTSPVSSQCDCLTCRAYSRAYLRHLHKAGDSSAYRLATIHNLRFYTQFMERLRSCAAAAVTPHPMQAD